MEVWEHLRFIARDMTNGLNEHDRQILEDAANDAEEHDDVICTCPPGAYIHGRGCPQHK